MTTTAGGLGEWGSRPPARRSAAPVFLSAGLVVGLVAILLGVLSLFLGLAAAVLGIGFLSWFAAGRGRAALKDSGARRATQDEFPRVSNLLSGLAAEHGITVPALWVAPGDGSGPNAMATWQGGPVVIVTEGFEDHLTRTECEGVLAHCTVRLASGEARATTLRTGAGPFGPSGTEAAAADLLTVAQTRYPPALAGALRKAAPRSGTFAALWFAPAAGGEASPARRAAVLETL